MIEEDRARINELIEIFGYPYDADIGVNGTYPAGYDGPDIYNYDLIERTDLTDSEKRCSAGADRRGRVPGRDVACARVHADGLPGLLRRARCRKAPWLLRRCARAAVTGVEPIRRRCNHQDGRDRPGLRHAAATCRQSWPEAPLRKSWARSRTSCGASTTRVTSTNRAWRV